MGEKDILTKKFMSRPDVFADAFNYLMYEGEPVIKPEKLTQLDVTAIAVAYAGSSKNPMQRVRDVLKEWVCMADDEMAYMVLGVENQSNIHYAMPVRNMLYDAIQYENQVKDAERIKKSNAQDSGGEYMSGFGKHNQLKPVVTLVVYFGDKTWDAPTSLYEMFGPMPPNVQPFISDYKINLICPVTMKPERLNKLTSDFKEAMTFIKYLEDEEKIKEIFGENRHIHVVDNDTIRMLNVLTDANLKINTGEEKVDMCAAIENIRAEGRAEGKVEGKVEGKAEERQKGIFALISAMKKFKISHEEILNELKIQYNLTDDEVEQYMKLAEA